MTRYKATKEGMLPFTADDEAEADARSVTLLEHRRNELREHRKQVEFGGFTFNGQTLSSDKEDQRKIDGAVLGAQLFPDTTINFKTKTGYVQIDSQTMISIGKALFAHVQACHTREMELIAALNENIETDITTGWPE